jgi:hypothetical protein
MIDAKDLRATCDIIVREFAPQRVILFGSHAYGVPTYSFTGRERSEQFLLPIQKAEEHGGLIEPAGVPVGEGQTRLTTAPQTRS